MRRFRKKTVLTEKEEELESKKKLMRDIDAQYYELQEALLFGGFSFEDFSYINDNEDKVEVSAEEFIAAWDEIGAAECLRYGEL